MLPMRERSRSWLRGWRKPRAGTKPRSGVIGTWRGLELPGYRMARLPSWLILGSLVLLLGILAWYQYRWTGEVSRAERARMRGALTTVLQAYAQDFNRELTRLALIFVGTGVEPDRAGLAPSIARAQEQWEETGADPQLLRNIWVAHKAASGDVTLRRFDPGAVALNPAPWPAALAPVRRDLESLDGAFDDDRPARVRWPGPVADEIPALILPIDVLGGVMEGMETLRPGPAGGRPLIPEFLPSFLILELDLAHLRKVYFPRLSRRHQLIGEASSYEIAIVDEAGDRIYGTGSTRGAESHHPDGSAELFAFLAPPEANDLWRALGGSPTPRLTVRLDVNAVQDGDGEDVVFDAKASGGGPWMAPILQIAGGPDGEQPAWRILAFHREGSLDAVVSQARMRNLLVVVVILALLAASVGFLVVSNRRARLLALQQMDFVAAMTHELRTPLATIGSLGENLAHGVVSGEDQARRYGAMIVRQERRLATLVEDVLEFAGMGLTAPSRLFDTIDARGPVIEAIEETRSIFFAADASLDTELPEHECLVEADSEALSRALQNLLCNAVKFGGTAPSVAIRLEDDEPAQEIRVSVRDRGPGIDAEDLPRVFEPFFRAVRARADKVPGSGLGLALVQRIVTAHDGHVDVESQPGRGTTFTIHLPAASPPR